MARRGAIIAGQSNDTVPSAPTITSITPGNGYLDVNFTAGADGGRPITGYECRTDELGDWSIASGTTSPIRISSLFNGTVYHVRIRAINMEGTGTQSNLISQSPYTVPSAPTISTISIGVKSLSVSGSAGSDNGSAITNYKYSINDGSTFTAFSPAQTSFPLIISGLADATTYPVVVRAVNAAGDGLVSNTVSQITASAPSKPAPPTITSVGDATISISWVSPTANNSTITSYTYQRSSDDGANWTTVASTASTSADISSLTNGTSYKFRVNATNAAGTSEWSEKSLADAPWTTPGAPTSVTAVKGDTLVDVSWTAPVGTGGYPLSTYRLDYKAGSGAWVGGGSATGTSKQITGLSNGTTYTFRVQASNTRSTTTFGAFGESGTAVPSGVPAQVGTPTSSSGDKNFTISWTAPGSNGSDITGYRVQRSTDGGATWGDTATTTGTSYNTWNSVNGTSYIGRVQAYNANGDGAYSAASAAKTPAFASSGTISASQNTATPPSYRDTDNALLANGVGPGGGARPYTVSFDPPNVAGFLRSRIYAKFDYSDWRQVGSDIGSNGADTLGVSSIPDSTWFDIPITISYSAPNVSFFMRTYNSDESYIDTAAVSYSAEGLKYYYTYDTTDRSTTTGFSYFDYNTYSNDVNTGEKDGDTWIKEVVAQASNDTGTTATIATSGRNFFVRYYLGTSYPAVGSANWNSFSGTNQSFPWWNNSGTTLRNGTIQANAVPSYTGLRLRVSGAGTITSGWTTSTRVRFVITYRNRYSNSW
jgi:hypothetical protein